VVAAAGRAINIISHPGSTGASRKISRSNRFTLFLVTALPIRLLTEKPYLDKLSPLGNAFITIKLLTHDLPSLFPLLTSLLTKEAIYQGDKETGLKAISLKTLLTELYHNQFLTTFESSCF